MKRTRRVHAVSPLITSPGVPKAIACQARRRDVTSAQDVVGLRAAARRVILLRDARVCTPRPRTWR